jgi:hypothetical protein
MSLPVHIGLSLRDADAHTRLSTYLNDHLGGASGGVELARRACRANRGNHYGELLERIAGEIEEDIASLIDVMHRLDVREDRLKQVAGWSGEKLGRLKPNGQLLGYSPLSRLVELEGLVLGVTGKVGLWTALKTALGTDPRLAGVDLDVLEERARAQRRDLEAARRQAAVEALN